MAGPLGYAEIMALLTRYDARSKEGGASRAYYEHLAMGLYEAAVTLLVASGMDKHDAREKVSRDGQD